MAAFFAIMLAIASFFGASHGAGNASFSSTHANGNGGGASSTFHGGTHTDGGIGGMFGG